jgi:hypothetical protein
MGYNGGLVVYNWVFTLNQLLSKFDKHALLSEY